MGLPGHDATILQISNVHDYIFLKDSLINVNTLDMFQLMIIILEQFQLTKEQRA